MPAFLKPEEQMPRLGNIEVAGQLLHSRITQFWLDHSHAVERKGGMGEG